MNKYAIVTDFDGTVTTLDIGNTMAINAGSTTEEEIEKDYAANTDAKDWMNTHFGRMKFTPEEFESLVLGYAEIKDGFEELARYAGQNDIPFEIASGGLDLYINPVLKRADLAHIPVYSMRGVYNGEGRITVDFPYFEDMTLGRFKASRVKFYKERGYTVIFLGDGVSDFQAAQSADIVFATDHLERLCKEHKVNFFKLKDFNKALSIVKGEYVPLSA